MAVCVAGDLQQSRRLRWVRLLIVAVGSQCVCRYFLQKCGVALSHFTAPLLLTVSAESQDTTNYCKAKGSVDSVTKEHCTDNIVLPRTRIPYEAYSELCDGDDDMPHVEHSAVTLVFEWISPTRVSVGENDKTKTHHGERALHYVTFSHANLPIMRTPALLQALPNCFTSNGRLPPDVYSLSLNRKSRSSQLSKRESILQDQDITTDTDSMDIIQYQNSFSPNPTVATLDKVSLNLFDLTGVNTVVLLANNHMLEIHFSRDKVLLFDHSSLNVLISVASRYNLDGSLGQDGKIETNGMTLEKIKGAQPMWDVSIMASKLFPNAMFYRQSRVTYIDNIEGVNRFVFEISGLRSFSRAAYGLYLDICGGKFDDKKIEGKKKKKASEVMLSPTAKDIIIDRKNWKRNQSGASIIAGNIRSKSAAELSTTKLSTSSAGDRSRARRTANSRLATDPEIKTLRRHHFENRMNNLPDRNSAQMTGFTSDHNIVKLEKL